MGDVAFVVVPIEVKCAPVLETWLPLAESTITGAPCEAAAAISIGEFVDIKDGLRAFGVPTDPALPPC